MLDTHALALLMRSHWPSAPKMSPLLLLCKPENIAEAAEGGARGKERVAILRNADEL